MVQFIANGFLYAAIYLIYGIAFIITFRFCKRFDMSLPAIGTVASYTALYIQPIGGIVVGLASGLITASLLGLILQKFIYQRLNTWIRTSLGGLLASLGLYIVILNTLSLFFGNNRQSIRRWAVREGFPIFGAKLTIVQLCIISLSLFVSLLLWAFLRFSRKGKALRALSSDAELASISGLNTSSLNLLAMTIASVTVGVAGLFQSCDTDLTPNMALYPFMIGVAAGIIGKFSILGVVIGAFILALLQQLSIIWLPSLWQDTLVFSVLLAVMFFLSKAYSQNKL